MGGDPETNTEKQAKQVAAKVKPWAERFSRYGLATKGIVYATSGVLSAQAALSVTEQTIGSRSALEFIVARPLGKIMLGVVAIGLCGYALWRFIEGILDPDHNGFNVGGIVKRGGYLLSGLAYTGLAFAAVEIILDTSEVRESSIEIWTARLLAQPFGRWLVGVAAFIVFGLAFGTGYKAFTTGFRNKLNLGEMNRFEIALATSVGSVGLIARGIVLCVTSVFLATAALHDEASEAGGLAQVLEYISRQPFGAWLLGAASVGLIAYGLYLMIEAKYRHISLD